MTLKEEEEKKKLKYTWRSKWSKHVHKRSKWSKYTLFDLLRLQCFYVS